MNSPDLSPQAALELKRLWGTRSHMPWRSETIGPDGEKLFVFQHTSKVPILMERPVASRRLGAELAWRVAFDVIALKIKLRGKVAAFLRPILTGEADNLRHRQDLLRIDWHSYAERRDKIIDGITNGQQRKVILRREDMLLAVLGPLPPTGAEPLTAATVEEIEMLRRLRASRISRQELKLLLDVWDEQQERLSESPDGDEYLPVVRIIPQAEDSMLRDLRQAGIHSREQLVMLLMELPHAAVPGGRPHS